DQLIGLADVKAELRRMIAEAALAGPRSRAGLRLPSPTRHMVFTGNPGTAKTTIARLLAQAMAAHGLLATGQPVDATRADLVPTLTFPDYDADELAAIFDLFCRRAGVLVAVGARDQVSVHLARLPHDRSFANGRTVRNLFERLLAAQAARLHAVARPTDDDLRTLTEA